MDAIHTCIYLVCILVFVYTFYRRLVQIRSSMNEKRIGTPRQLSNTGMERLFSVKILV